jgi:hypothetical protein
MAKGTQKERREAATLQLQHIMKQKKEPVMAYRVALSGAKQALTHWVKTGCTDMVGCMAYGYCRCRSKD